MAVLMRSANSITVWASSFSRDSRFRAERGPEMLTAATIVASYWRMGAAIHARPKASSSRSVA